MQDIPIEILKEAAEGDIEAFERLYRLTCGFVYNVALRVIRNCADAEEITQDVFMKVYHSLKDFHFHSSFRTWIYRITVNTAINRYRSTRREKKDRVDFDAVIDTVPVAQSSEPDALAKSDNQVRLNKLLEGLNPEYKVCIVLREIEGLSYKEIAASLNIPVNTVRSRLKRAREALLELRGGRDAL